MRGDHSDALALADAPSDLDILVREDAERWQKTHTWKMSHGGSTDFGIARRRCMLERAKGRLEGKECNNDLTVLVHRVDRELGEVVYVRPRLPGDSTDGCRSYSECVSTRAWMGREVPLPEGDEEYFAFVAGDVLIPFTGSDEERLAHLREEVEQLSGRIATLTTSEGSAEGHAELELLQDLLAYDRWVLENE